METECPIRYNPADHMESGMRFDKIINELRVRGSAALSKLTNISRRSGGDKADKPNPRAAGRPKPARGGVRKIPRGSLGSKIRKPRTSKFRIRSIPWRSWCSKVFNVRVLVWLLAAVIVLAGLLYIQASRLPDNYRPARLTQAEAKQATHRFARDVLEGFGNKVKLVKPFEWSIEQSTANRYLAAMDEIAFNLPNGVRRGKLNEEMARLGLADPAVALDDGRITLMIRSTTYGKVLSAEIGVELVDDNKLKFTLHATRIGKLPAPTSLLTGRIEDIASRLTGEHPDAISETLAELLSAINGDPVSPPDSWRIQGVKVSIEAITIADGELKLKVRPVAKPRK